MHPILRRAMELEQRGGLPEIIGKVTDYVGATLDYVRANMTWVEPREVSYLFI